METISRDEPEPEAPAPGPLRRWRIRASLAALVTALLTSSPGGAQTPPRAWEPPRGMPRVHIETSDPQVRLYRLLRHDRADPFEDDLGHSYWRWGVPICVAPCDQIVDGRAGQQFQFNASGMLASAPFKLDALSGDVTFTVAPGAYAHRVGGIVMTALGGTALTGGIAFSILAVSSAGEARRQFAGPGAGLSAVGLGVLVGGIALAVLGRTSVKMSHPVGRSARFEGGVLRF